MTIIGIVMLFDGGSDDAFHSDSITAHHDWHRLSIDRQHGRAHRLGVFRTELEDVTDLHRFENFQCAYVTTRTTLAGSNTAQVSPLIRLYVSFNFHASQVVIVFVRSCGHVAPRFESEVGHNQEFKVSLLCTIPGANATEAPGPGTE